MANLTQIGRAALLALALIGAAAIAPLLGLLLGLALGVTLSCILISRGTETVIEHFRPRSPQTPPVPTAPWGPR